MSEHEFRPSRLGLRALCPGSLEMERGLPATDSEEAAEGRLLHQAMAGTFKPPLELTEEQEALLEQCDAFSHAKLVEVFGDDEGVAIEQETPLEIRVGDDAIPGTADFLAVGGKKALLIDWKFGRGNLNADIVRWQMMAYALGALQRFRVDTIMVYVYAPRLAEERHGEFYSKHATAYESAIREVIKDTRFVRLFPGDHCQWCRAKAQCSACTAWLRKETDLVPRDQPMALWDAGAIRKTAEFCQKARPILDKAWDSLKDLPAEILAEAGLEIVERQGNRYISDPREAVKRLNGVVTPAELIDRVASFPLGKVEMLAVEKLAVDGVTKADAKRDFERRLGEVIQRGKPARILKVKETEDA